MKLDGYIDKDCSARFSKMGFLSAMCIVYLHTGCAADGEVVGSSLHRMIETFCRVAIPWFFYAAGFFLAGRIGENGWYKKEVLKRVKTLLIPFWIWSGIICLFWVLIAVAIRLTGYNYNGINAFEWITPKGLLTVVGLNPLGNIPTMWFLRSLFLFVFLSPVIYRGRALFVFVAFLSYAYFEIEYCNMERDIRYLLESFLSLRGLAYFSLGVYIRANRCRLSAIGKTSLSIIGVVVFVATCFLSGIAARLLDVLMVPFLMVALFSVVARIKMSERLTSNAFPLYLIHGMVAYLVSAIYGVAGMGGKSLFVFGLVKWIVSIVFSLMITSTLRNHFPQSSKILFGGR